MITMKCLIRISLLFYLWEMTISGVGSQVSSRLEGLEWWEIQKYMTAIVDNGLYQRKIQDRLDRDFKWSKTEVNPAQFLARGHKHYNTLFGDSIQVLQKLRNSIVENFKDFVNSEPIHHCCEMNKDDAVDVGCFHGKDLKTGLGANPPKKVVEMMEDIRSVFSSVTLLYFGLNDGTMFAFPVPINIYKHRSKCQEFNTLIRPWYGNARSPVPRNIVVLLDFRPSSSEPERNLMLTAAHDVLDTLTKTDRIVILSQEKMNEQGDVGRHVELGVWLTGTARNRNKLKQLLEASFKHLANTSTKSQSLEDKMEAVENAFQTPMKLSINISRKAENVIVHIVSSNNSHCLNSSLWKARNVSLPVFITYIIGSNSSQSCQNLSKDEYAVNINGEEDFKHPNKTFNNFFRWSKYLNDPRFGHNILNEPRITLPYTSYYSGTIISTMTLPIIVDEVFIGAVGYDVSKLVTKEIISKVEGFEDSYSFLVDEGGYAIFHPLLPTPYCYDLIESHNCEHPTYELVNRLEQNRNVLDILQSMLDMKKGSEIVEGDIIQSTGHVLGKDLGNPVIKKKRKMSYSWMPLTSIKLSLAFVFLVRNGKVFNATFDAVDKQSLKDNQISYHLKMDKPGSTTCSLFGSDVFPNEYALKFAPTVFKDPVRYMFTTDVIVKAINEGKDFTTLFRENGPRESIMLVNTIGDVWKTAEDNLECFIGVRFMGTPDGVVMFYPGTTLNATYDHRTRGWYQMAITNRKPYPSLSLTTPYRDFLSGGMVISVSTVIEKQLPPDFSVMVGVMGVDFSTTFLVHKFKERLPKCDGKNVTCFFIDTLGYITLHLNNETIHGLHITEAYPKIAQELVKSNILYRDGCHDYENDAVFLYWQFELHPEVTTFLSGKDLDSFIIHEIPFTNMYLIATLSAEPISKRKDSFVCESSCFQRVEPLCKVDVTTKCKVWEDDMRQSFVNMPACYPSAESPTNKVAKKHCRNNTKNTCFSSLKKEECALWKTNCNTNF